jgi:hypothetical protein
VAQRPGRPFGTRKDARVKKVSAGFCCTPAEEKYLHEKADSMGMSFSEFMIAAGKQYKGDTYGIPELSRVSGESTVVGGSQGRDAPRQLPLRATKTG